MYWCWYIILWLVSLVGSMFWIILFVLQLTFSTQVPCCWLLTPCKLAALMVGRVCIGTVWESNSPPTQNALPLTSLPVSVQYHHETPLWVLQWDGFHQQHRQSQSDILSLAGTVLLSPSSPAKWVASVLLLVAACLNCFSKKALKSASHRDPSGEQQPSSAVETC